MITKEDAATLFYETSLKSNKRTDSDPAAQEKMLAELRERAAYLAERVLEAIDAQNIDAIRGFLWRENKASVRIFKRHTGLRFGRTQKEIDGAIRAWVGVEIYDTHQAERNRKSEERRRRRVEDAHNRRFLAALSKEYKTPGGVKTIKAIIDEAIQRGFTKILERKRGFATVLYLHDGTRGILLRTKHEQEYAWQCVEKLRRTTQEQKENNSCDL